MVLFNEKAMELDEKQFNLQMDIYSHDIHSMLDMYTESCYMEETSPNKDEKATKSTEKTSILKTIVAKLKSLIGKIGEMIDAFRASVESKKKNLTAEEYMGSETARIQFAYDLAAIQREVDAEYLEARKIVSGISKITNVPVEKVANFCDRMEQKIHDNKSKILPAGKAIVTTVAIEKTRNAVRDSIYKSKDITARSKKLSDDFDKAIGVEPKKEDDPETDKKLSVMTRFMTVVGKLEKKWMRVSNTLDSELKRAMKK